MHPQHPRSTLFPYTTLFRSTYFKISWVHKKRGELEEALEADLKALKLMEAIDDKLGIAGANNRLSEDVLRQGREQDRSEEHTSELQSRPHLVCRLLLEKKNI